MLNKTDIDLITGFLEQELDAFANYLDEHDIEPTEAGVIIENIKDE